jgi:hypothetical protein
LQPHFDAPDLSIAGGKFNGLKGTAFFPRYPELVMAGLVPATPLSMARLCQMIGVAGTSPAMTLKMKRRQSVNREKRPRLRGAKGYHQHWNF